jgi:hypothetical protein
MAVFEKSQGFWIAKAIAVACELNLAEIVSDEKKSIEKIAEESKTEAAALFRLMRALASEGIFIETSPKIFSNNKLSNALIEKPGNLKNMIMHQLNKTNWDVVNELKFSVQSGTNAAQKLLGADIFTHLQNTPEKNALYNKAMSETSGLSSAAVVSAYSFSGIKVLADIGGGEGTLLNTILNEYSNLTGILFDLPHVVETAESLAKRFQNENRLRIISGSFFKDKIPEADAYLLKNILHAFDDETSVQLLKSINRSMSGKGKVLIIEAVISEDNKTGFGKISDLQMLLGTEMGKERTQEEYRSILEKAGFKLNKLVKTVSPFSIVEGIKI